MKDAKALVTRGERLFKQGELEEAVACFRDAMAARPGSFDILRRSAVPMIELGALEEATGLLKAVLSRDPSAAGRPGAELVRTITGRIGADDLTALLSLVRAESWLDPHALVLEAARGLSPFLDYELAVLRCVAAWTSADPAGIRQGLADAGGAFLALPERDRQHPEIRQTAVFHGLLLGLAKHADPRQFPSPDEPAGILAIGDSHALCAGNTRVPIGGKPSAVRSRLVVGIKAWHLARPGRNRFKRLVGSALDGLAPGTIALFSFGEIDCRLTEGIIPHHRKTRGDLAAGIGRLVEDAVGHAAARAQERGIPAMFMTVPAPNPAAYAVRPSAADAALLLDVIRRFNDALKGVCRERGLRVADTYALSAGADGLANGLAHCDTHHLKPGIVSQAIAAALP